MSARKIQSKIELENESERRVKCGTLSGQYPSMHTRVCVCAVVSCHAFLFRRNFRR